MLELFPEGFEEVEQPDGVEFVAYTEPSGEERLWQAFGAVSASEVEAGWEDGWRRFHRPVRVGSLWVGPPWEEAPADAPWPSGALTDSPSTRYKALLPRDEGQPHPAPSTPG